MNNVVLLRMKIWELHYKEQLYVPWDFASGLPQWELPGKALDVVLWHCHSALHAAGMHRLPLSGSAVRTIWMSEGTLWHMSKQNQNTQYATSANSGLLSEILYFENELISAVLLLKQKKKKICTVTTRSGVTEPTSVFSSSHVCTDLFCPKRSFPATSNLKGWWLPSMQTLGICQTSLVHTDNRFCTTSTSKNLNKAHLRAFEWVSPKLM